MDINHTRSRALGRLERRKSMFCNRIFLNLFLLVPAPVLTSYLLRITNWKVSNYLCFSQPPNFVCFGIVNPFWPTIIWLTDLHRKFTRFVLKKISKKSLRGLGQQISHPKTEDSLYQAISCAESELLHHNNTKSCI